MPSLLELYRPMLTEVGGRRLDLHDFDPEVQVAWDKFAQENGVDSAEFLERSGRIYANTRGRGWFEWDGTTFRPAEKPGPVTGPETGKHRAVNWRDRFVGPDGAYDRNAPARSTDSLWDIFSKDFHGFRANVSQAAARLYGKDWESVIEGVYGKGSVDRMFSELWRNFWTDHEALGEVGHYYDAAAQSDGDAAPNYNMQIGPRYDVSRDEEPDDVPPPWERQECVRRKRVTSADYFANLWSSS